MRLTWNEMVKQYPDSWLVLAEVELCKEGIKSGVVLASCQDDNLEKLNEILLNHKGDSTCMWARTTWISERNDYFDFD